MMTDMLQPISAGWGGGEQCATSQVLFVVDVCYLELHVDEILDSQRRAPLGVASTPLSQYAAATLRNNSNGGG
eukprot:6211100-Pleurochrysis_carterae.AAC.1